MHWLFQMINYLANKEVLDWQGEGFGWDSKTNLADHVPDNLLNSVEVDVAGSSRVSTDPGMRFLHRP